MGNDERTGVLAGGDRAVNEPAQRVLLIGPILNNARKAMQGSTKALTAASKAFAEFEFVDRARAEWNILLPELPRRDLMQNVTFKSLSQHPFEPMQTFEGVDAWVNSSTEIYVAETTKNQLPAWWRAVLYHEALHVQQFAEEGGPPESYTQMVNHEFDAYGEAAKWLDEANHPERYPPQQIIAGRDAMEEQQLVFDRLKREFGTKDDKEREREYKRFLVNNSLLPKHEDIEDLYGL